MKQKQSLQSNQHILNLLIIKHLKLAMNQSSSITVKQPAGDMTVQSGYQRIEAGAMKMLGMLRSNPVGSPT